MHIITRSAIAAAALAAIGLAAPAVAFADIITDETTIDADLIGTAGTLEQGAFLDTMATEDSLNSLLGVSSTTSETAVLSDFATLFPGATLPTGDSLPDVGATNFDADLFNIANGDFTSAGTGAVTDITTLLPSLGTDATGLLGALPGDLTNLLPDLLSALGL